MHPLAALRQQLAEVIAPTHDAGSGGSGAGKNAGIPTGIPELDAVLSDGGLPCGRLTEIIGERGSGKTTVVRTLVEHALADKRWVAYIDVSRTLAPVDWAPLAESGRLWIVRPPPPPPKTPDHGAWCADVLLRSAAFSLVVLDGGAALARSVAVRLTRLARESHAAFVVMRDIPDPARGTNRDSHNGSNNGSHNGSDSGGGLVGGAVRIRVTRRPSPPTNPASGSSARRDLDRWRSLGTRLARASGEFPAPWDTRPEAEHGTGRPHRPRMPNDRWRPHAVSDDDIAPSLGNTYALTLSVEKGGAHHPVEVGCAIDVARRLCTHSEVPDRRGVAPRNRRGERASPDAPGVRRAADTPARGGEPQTPGTAHGTVTPPLRASGATLAHKRRFAEPVIHRDEFLLPPPKTRAAGTTTTPARPSGGRT